MLSPTVHALTYRWSHRGLVRCMVPISHSNFVFAWSGLCVNSHSQPSFCSGHGFWLEKGRLLLHCPFPHGALLLQPPQGGDFCLSIMALSSIPRSGAVRRAKPGPSHKSAGLIELPWGPEHPLPPPTSGLPRDVTWQLWEGRMVTISGGH